jgi:hypothetical protein
MRCCLRWPGIAPQEDRLCGFSREFLKRLSVATSKRGITPGNDDDEPSTEAEPATSRANFAYPN